MSRDIKVDLSSAGKAWVDFLNSLLDHQTGGLSSEEIQAYINSERASWDD
ncbi:MAG: hypothetical protein HOP34_12115 [Methylococcaceae bacterium]|nr:hypothetical protein [Methylococcaceae bacterium]